MAETLAAARETYQKVLANYRKIPPADPEDRRVQKLAEFYHADTVFDLGEYARAVELYNAAAYRHQDDPAALGAYVQIANAHLKLGQTEQAKTVNERAKWLLRRMPDDAFAGGDTLSRDQWARWLDWAGESGMW